jgi:hypothetical protein
MSCGGGTVPKHRFRQAVPNLDGESEGSLGGIERNEPKGVVDEMRRNIGEQHEAGCHPQVPTVQTEPHVPAQNSRSKQSDDAYLVEYRA